MPKITINDFSGGIAQEPESTIANQFAMGWGLNIDRPHQLTVNQALKAYGNTELKKVVNCGGNSFGYYNDVIYGYNTSVYSFKHTNTKGVMYNIEPLENTLVYVTGSRVGKCSAPFNSTGYNDSVGILSSISTAHSLCAWNSEIYIGNANKLAKYNLSTFTDDILPLEVGYYVNDITDDGNYLIILLRSAYEGKPDKIYWWDGYSEHYNSYLTLPFKAEALGKIENSLVVFCNQDGSIFQVSPTGWSPVVNKTLWYDGDTQDIYTLVHGTANGFSASSNFKNGLLYGIQEGTQTHRGGIWHIGKNPFSGNMSVNWYWRPKDAQSAYYALNSISNQSVSVYSQPNAFISLTSGGSGKRVMVIDYSNKNTDAGYQSLILDGGSPTIRKRFDFIKITTKPLPANTSFTVKRKINRESSWVDIGTYSTTGRTSQKFLIPSSNVGENIQIQFIFTVSGNTAPTITSYEITYTPIGD